MPRKKVVNNKKLIEAVKAGKSSKELMKEFGIKTSAQLKSLYLDALAHSGDVPAIRVSRKSGDVEEKVVKQIQVNKRGSLVVTKELIESMGFTIGDSFTVRKTAAGVSLKKAK